MSSFGKTTATQLSGEYSHDQVARLLSRNHFDSRSKKSCEEIEKEDAVLIVDDTIQEKPYSDENSLIS